MNRTERYAEFSKFQATGKEIIEGLESKYGSIFSKYYSFCITPKGRYGGNDKTIFEYFYGKRFYDRTVRRVLVECGATMLYQRHDDGYVSCLLYPAKPENMSRIEDFIFLNRHLSPQKITTKLLEKHFKYFISYMKVTSLDGSPSLWDRFKIWRLMLCNQTVPDGKAMPIKIISYISSIIKFGLTVGLSGFILYLIQLFFPNPTPTISIYYL